MSEKTGIEWCDATWNPVVGCEKVSGACKFCYAIRDAWRLGHNPNSKISTIYQDLAYKNEDGSLNWTGVVKCLPERLNIPLAWKKPLRIFVNSQSDLFHKDVPDGFIDQVFAVMAACPQHTFMILTKRPEGMMSYCSDKNRSEKIIQAGKELGLFDYTDLFLEDCLSILLPKGYPLRNVWLGVSVEDQKAADQRIPLLLQTPATVRWISVEPLLGHMDLVYKDKSGYTVDYLNGTRSRPDWDDPKWDRYGRLDWVVVGGESGKDARPMAIEWVRWLRDECVGYRIPFFFKQWGEWTPNYHDGLSMANREMTYQHEHVFYKLGKKLSGRLLDGVEWNQMPGEING